MTKKSRQKLKYLKNEKSFKMKQKAFFINIKGLPLNKIKHFWGEGESPTFTPSVVILLCFLSFIYIKD